jgi:hypothetical protein
VRLEEEVDPVPLQPRKAAVPGPRPVIGAGETLARTIWGLLASYLRGLGDQHVLLADCGTCTREVVKQEVGA